MTTRFIEFDMRSPNISDDIKEARLQEFFEGPLPLVGDKLEMVVVERKPGVITIQMKIKED